MDRSLLLTPPDAAADEIPPFATWIPDCVENAASDSWHLDSSDRRDRDVLGVPPPLWDTWLKALRTCGTPSDRYIEPDHGVRVAPIGRRYGREILDGDTELWYADEGTGICAAVAPQALSRLEGWGWVVDNKAAITRTISPRYIWGWGDGKWVPRAGIDQAAVEAGVPVGEGPQALLEAERQAFTELAARTVIRGREVTPAVRATLAARVAADADAQRHIQISSATRMMLAARFLLPILMPATRVDKRPSITLRSRARVPAWKHLPIFNLLDVNVQQALLAYRAEPTGTHWESFRQAVGSARSNATFRRFGEEFTRTLSDPSQHHGDDERIRAQHEDAFDYMIYKSLLARTDKELGPRTFVDSQDHESIVVTFSEMIFYMWKHPESLGARAVGVMAGRLPPDKSPHGDS